MSVQVYLTFNGNCREALDFYSDAFGTEMPRVMTFGDAPPSKVEFSIPDEAKNLIMHAELKISGDTIMFSDSFPGTSVIPGNNINLTIVSTDMDEIKTWFSKLKVGGKVEMDLQETFWSKCYGSLVDKFGIYWQLSHTESTTS